MSGHPLRRYKDAADVESQTDKLPLVKRQKARLSAVRVAQASSAACVSGAARVRTPWGASAAVGRGS